MTDAAIGMTDADIDIAFFCTADGPEVTFPGLAGAVGRSSDRLASA
jgi:hypothetical protein